MSTDDEVTEQMREPKAVFTDVVATFIKHTNQLRHRLGYDFNEMKVLLLELSNSMAINDVLAVRGSFDNDLPMAMALLYKKDEKYKLILRFEHIPECLLFLPDEPDHVGPADIEEVMEFISKDIKKEIEKVNRHE